jgi:4-diphosphocytidyl-2-C-methyl-D-erythritol kinase
MGFPITVKAPAKINLFLEVIGKLPSGRHELFSLMARLKLSDEIKVSLLGESPKPLGCDRSSSPGEPLGSPGDGLSYEFRVPGSPDAGFMGENNLVLKALFAYRRLTGFPREAYSIHLIKNIPPAAGLGGGSSDGAAILKLLNSLSGGLLNKEELKSLALSLGADVPFFLEDESLCLARGVGESLSPWKGERPFPLVLLLNPGTPLKTREVFMEYELTKREESNNLSLNPALSRDKADFMAPRPPFRGAGRPSRQEPDSEPGKASGHWGNHPPFGHNDLAPVAFKLSPALRELYHLLLGLKEGPVGLSGSGPTLFGLFKTEEKLGFALDRLKGRFTLSTKIL